MLKCKGYTKKLIIFLIFSFLASYLLFFLISCFIKSLGMPTPLILQSPIWVTIILPVPYLHFFLIFSFHFSMTIVNMIQWKYFNQAHKSLLCLRWRLFSMKVLVRHL